MSISREIARIITAHRQTEGAGFVVRRPYPSAGLDSADPFLLLDEMGPIEHKAGEAVGAPDHPHRGFETVTYLLEGEAEHEDSAGNHGFIRAGDVQWMTAGSGVVHSEMPSKRMQKSGGQMHGFQIWVNLPARLKMTPPRYQEVASERIPQARSVDGLATVRVIAGEALGVRAVIDTHTPIVYQDWTLQAGADVTTEVPRDHQVLVYVFEGAASVGASGQLVQDGQLAVLGVGDTIRLSATQGARILLLAGVPLNEPVARYGPFVMNTQAEIQQAFRDYREGRMGMIMRASDSR